MESVKYSGLIVNVLNSDCKLQILFTVLNMFPMDLQGEFA